MSGRVGSRSLEISRSRFLRPTLGFSDLLLGILWGLVSSDDVSHSSLGIELLKSLGSDGEQKRPVIS